MSREPEVLITLDGVSRTAYEWAKEVGISANTIRGRIERGWTPFEALTTKPESKGVAGCTKSDAESALNDMSRAQLPESLEKWIPKDYRGGKFGEILRTQHRKAFDLWYSTIFVPNHAKK